MTRDVRTYLARVVNNKDPEKRGRVKVSCPDLVGTNRELPDWVEPLLDWGWFYVPDVDELIEIEVLLTTGRDTRPLESSLHKLNMKWRGGRVYGGEKTDAPRPIPDQFTENYKRRGIATPLGHILFFDDTPGEQTVTLSWSDGSTPPVYSSITVDTDGTIKLSLGDGQHLLHLKENELEVKLSEGASLKVTGKDSSTVTVLGDGGVKAAIADHLQTLYTQAVTGMKPTFDDHIHPTGMGPSGKPVTQFPGWNSAINSNKLKFPDG
jgi:hypothetical protein